ncbi:MAG: FAD-dependent oxidoreductase [Gammaproteobacteria bacterium]|nr:FAD-dependent oxidoreductase [Gammaproteobacteria bacterium]
MQDTLGKPIDGVLDGENNAVEFDIAYPVRGDLCEATEQLRRKHGDELLLLPMSATSSGGGIFQNAGNADAMVVGLRFDAPPNPRLRREPVADLRRLQQDEIVIDRKHQQISAGAAITLNQLNRALADELGHQYKVPGADLTSYMYAAVGATFMTGGMGPQRRYFSDSVVEAAIYDGEGINNVCGEALQGYAGTYGWSGIVCALRCRYCRFPANEIAFALPVSSDAARLARLLAHLAPYAYLDLNPDKVVSRAGSDGMILGIEHVSCDSMRPLLARSGDNPARKRGLDLQQKCRAADVDGLVFINAYSEQSSDEFLIGLVDDAEAQDFTIAGIDIDHAEIFSDPEDMRALREAIPYAARTQAPDGRLVYKNHSDATIRMAPDEVRSCSERLWRINREYVEQVEQYFEGNATVEGQILVYGHLNPYGIDPHNRVTMSSDDENAFNNGREFLIAQRARYYRDLASMCESSNALFIGGEKSADSEIAIYAALQGTQLAPAALFARFQQQRETVRAAARLFNWRALPPYR